MAILGGKMKMTMAMKKKYNNAMAKCRRTHPHLSLMQRKKMAMAMCQKCGGYALGGAKKRVGRPRKHLKGGAKKRVGRPRKHLKGGAKKRVGRPRKHLKSGGYALGGSILGGYGLGGSMLGGYGLGGYALGGSKKKSTRVMTKSRASKKNIIELIDLLGL